MNIFGEGVLSSATSPILASLAPYKLSPATVLIIGGDVRVLWDATSNDYGSPVVAYTILFKDVNGGYVETSLCDGTDSFTISNRSCSVVMSTFTDDPGLYELTVNTPIIASVIATNAIGDSIQSDDNTVYGVAQTGPTTAPSGGAQTGSTSQTVIDITWNAIPAGQGRGLTINSVDTDYRVLWDAGTSGVTWSTISPSTGGATTFRMISGFNPGTPYQFKVQAFNEFGSSPESSVFYVLTASVPVQLAAATTAFANTNDVKVSWTATSDIRGSAVVGYRIKFKKSDGTYAEAAGSACTSVATPNPLECTIPMSVLTASPFSLAVGANIIARVEAANAIGYSAASVDSTTYATARSPPTVAPTLSRGSATS